MSTDKVIAEKTGAVARITMNNPARHNAMSLEMWEAATEHMLAFTADDEVRVIVITGAGDKAFVAGADISRFADERATQAAVKHYNETTHKFHDALVDCPKPTIARIKGFCIGGGVALAIGCDIRIAADDAQFGIPAAKLGLGYAYYGVERLVHLVGPSFAKELFYTAKRFSADDARIMGLVNRVVPAATLDEAVADYAQTIAENAPLTVRAIKATVNEVGKDPAKRDLARIDRMVNACFESKDYTEGRTAFMEKRKPQFVGA